MSIAWVMPSNHLIFCRPLFLPPSIFPSIGVFSNELVLRIRWPKYWSFSFTISPSNEYSGLTSFRIDWLDLLAVQGTLKSLLQYHSSKASFLNMTAHWKLIWSSGEKINNWSFLFFRKFQDNSDVPLEFKKWLQAFLLDPSLGDMEFYYFSVDQSWYSGIKWVIVT